MSYSADAGEIDQPVIDAANERKAGEAIKIRVQPSLFRRSVNQHRHWAGVSWTVDCASVEEAIALREALRTFFETLVAIGPEPTRVALQELAQTTHSA